MIKLRNAGGLFDFGKNMGWRYVAFRVWHEIQLLTGILKWRFPVCANSKSFITLEDWRNLPVKFFFEPANIQVKRNNSLLELKEKVFRVSGNEFQFFSHRWYHMADWHTNPATGFIYDKSTHWTKIQDFSKEAGDIKFVWEKSRFTFLYDLIRYDFHFKQDQSRLVFRFIEDWIACNPVNCGPNWRCSQEITIRVLNWLFTLHYYQTSAHLSHDLFDKIMGSIFQQMRHVKKNIRFSLIAVRNNHALTESLGLYLVGLLLPFFPESLRWKEAGKRWFEQEIAFQIDEDGTFLQSSMNYHRVVIQLLTWGIRLAELNGESWSAVVYDRAEKSLRFLRTCQDDETGHLPNYGNNDGALFFSLVSCGFRDFRPQLGALAKLLGIDPGYKPGNWTEESAWLLNPAENEAKEPILLVLPIISEFPDGGYYVLREDNTISFLRCGGYKNRPFQADNLHLDIWVDGENILRDAGSFLYNTEEKWTHYFSGTAAHNTIMLGDFDQMRRVSRFIWSDWIKEAAGRAWWNSERMVIEGVFTGFAHLGKNISHRRKVSKRKEQSNWIVEDWLTNVPAGVAVQQIWHPSEYFFEHYNIQAWDENNNDIMPEESDGWFSEYYGDKIKSRRLVFSTFGRYVRTVISAKV